MAIPIVVHLMVISSQRTLCRSQDKTSRTRPRCCVLPPFQPKVKVSPGGSP